MADAQGNIQRIGGELHQVTPIQDAEGNVVTHHVKALHLELSFKDVVQLLGGGHPFWLFPRRSPRKCGILDPLSPGSA